MPKHKTRNSFDWITWEINTVWWWNLFSLCHITKEEISSKFFTKTAAWKLVLGPFVFAKNEAYYWQMKFLKQATYIRYICNSKSIKICPNQHAKFHRIFFTKVSLKIKKGLELVSRPHFPYVLVKKLFCNIA